MISGANAVVYPWAVMIELVDAFVTECAVPASWGLEDLALVAKGKSIVIQHQIDESRFV